MAAFTVTTPEPGYVGQVGSVVFVDGAATVDEVTYAAELAYFRDRGYGVEPVDGGEPESVEVEDEAQVEDEEPDVEADAPPKKSASAAAWRAYAVTHGMSAEEADEFTRDQLVERFVVTEETAS
jgi:hypothetical protein